MPDLLLLCCAMFYGCFHDILLPYSAVLSMLLALGFNHDAVLTFCFFVVVLHLTFNVVIIAELFHSVFMFVNCLIDTCMRA